MAAALSGLRGEPAGGPARTSCGRAPASHGELSMSGKSRRDVLAAGAIVWRVAGRRLEVLLIHRPRYDDWAWPKGKLDGAHEPLAMCAVREVQEETGVAVRLGAELRTGKCRLGAKLPTVKYKLGNGTRKVVHYWAATPVAADGPAAGALRARGQIEPCSPDEVDQMHWVEANKARELLTRDDDIDPLGALLDMWDDDELHTWTLLVVR